jgi:putative inorganic carbon (HCO3(-)) transporter
MVSPVKLAIGVVILLVVGLPLAIGGVHLGTEVAAAVLGTVALAATARDAGRHGTRLRVDPFGFVLLGLVIVTALQVVPLPGFLLGLLSSATADAYGEATAFLGGDVASRTAFPVSLNAPATVAALPFLWAVFSVYVVSANLARRSEDTADALLKAVALSGAAVLGIGIVQGVAGLDGILGLYEISPSTAPAFLESTIVNPNHLAGFLALSGLVALGISHNAEQTRETLVYGALFLACISGAVLTLSRGGMVAALAGTAIFGFVSVRRQQPGMRTSTARMWMLGVLVVVTVVALLGYEAVVNTLATMPRFADDSPDVKLEVIARMKEVVLDHPITGVGAGAIGDVFGRYNDINPGVIFTHAENLPIQVAVNWGLPVAVIVLGFSAAALVPSLIRGSSQAILLGVGVGLYVLFMQNMVDFSLSIAGVAVPAAVCLGVLTGLDARDARTQGRRTRSVGLRRRTVYPIAGVAALLIPLGGLWAGSRDRSSADERLRDRFELATQLAEEGAPDDSLLPTDPEVVDIVLRHPTDAHVYLIEGTVQLRMDRPEEARRWFVEALNRAPLAFAPLNMLARTELRLGHTEAALDLYSTLLGAYRDRLDQVLPDLLALPRPAAALEQALGESDELRLGRVVDWLERRGHRAVATEMLLLRLERDAADYDARRLLGLLHLEDGALPKAEDQATQLIARHPERPAGFLIQGLVAERGGEAELAYHMFTEAHDLDPARADAMLGKARALVLLKDWDRLVRVVGELRPLVVGKPGPLGELHVILSRMADGQGDRAVAIHEMEMAVRLAPRNLGYLIRLGELYADTSEWAQARSVWQRALRLSPGNESLRARLADLEVQRERLSRTGL